MKYESGTSANEMDWPGLLNEMLTMPGALSSIFNRFYAYSLLNMLLLWQQGVREPVASYKVWTDMGRQPQKGTGKAIIHPAFHKEVDKNGQEKQVLHGYYLKRTAFAYSDTVGEELEMPDPPTWKKEVALANLNITQAEFVEMDGNMQGYSLDRTFAIMPVAQYPMHTMFHELGHIMLGHTTTEERKKYVFTDHRGIMEFQAEAVAYLLMNELYGADDTTAWDAASSRGYVKHWLDQAGGDDFATHLVDPVTGTLLKETDINDGIIRKIFSAADKILRAGRGSSE